MEFKYCTICGEKLIGKEIGDEGILPYCQSCQQPYFSIFNVSVLVAVMKDDKVLLIKQNYVSQNNWVLVAGYIQKGETAEETVFREVEEETGLKARECKYIESYFHVKNEMLMLGFLVSVDDDRCVPGKEVDEINWFNINEAVDLIREGSTAQKHIMNVRKYLGLDKS
ncbi:MAG: NUDIX domain-containing protein [Halanaerobiales bacterium]